MKGSAAMTQLTEVRAGSGARRWWALGALALSVLVVGLDVFVLTLAIPTLSVDLHASTSDAQWFLSAYSLVLAAALLPAGLLGDRYGRKKLLIWALILFGLASLACAYSVSSGELILARVALGLAAAVIMPLSLAVLPVMFTPEERPRAIATVGGATFLGFPLGPILGGWLLDNYWWGSVFLINVPIVVIALGRGDLADAGVAQRTAAADRRHRRDPVQRRAHGPHVRLHRGGQGRLERRRHAGHDRRRGGRHRRVHRLGAGYHPPGRAAADRPRAVPVAPASPGAQRWRP